MSKNVIPKSICEQCVRYKYGYCHLDDLSPCDFISKSEETVEKNTKIFLFCITILSLVVAVLFILFGCSRAKSAQAPEYHWSAVELLKEYHGEEDKLTEWQALTMAIALTESRFKPDAVGTLGDSGILQLREVYIQEVNRVCGTDYAIEDAFDIGKSIEIFNKMQEAKNPSYSIDKAIALHNSGDAYRQTVLRNLEEIKRYEVVRAKLIEK